MNDNQRQTRELLLKEMTMHVGRSRAIGMGDLYERVFGRPYRSKINGTRALRKLVTDLREEGVAICSIADADGGGYYLASAGSELNDYCKTVRSRALKMLALESKLRKSTLPRILDEVQLNLRMSAEG